jgi:hypothetical protein
MPWWLFLIIILIACIIALSWFSFFYISGEAELEGKEERDYLQGELFKSTLVAEKIATIT